MSEVIIGMQMRDFMNECYQEGIRIEVVINGYPVTLSGFQRHVIAELARSVFRNLQMNVLLHNPAAADFDCRCGNVFGEYG